jgi:rhamnogalacturonan endolyase
MNILNYFVVIGIALISIVNAAVTLNENNTSYILSNGLATFTIAKSSGFITSMKYKNNSQEFLNRSYIDANGGKVYFSVTSSYVSTKTSDLVEIVFVDDYSKHVGTGFALDWEVRYTMKSGVSGLYFSVTQSHKSSYEEAQCSELRLVMRLKSDVFNWLQVDDFNKRVMPSAADQNKCVTLSPKEACQLPSGEVIHKYDWSVDALEHKVHGFGSISKNLGSWYVIPSMEWKNGGAVNRDLSCHQGGTDSLQILYLRGSHYGAGDMIVKQGETWSKMHGPILIYLNEGSDVNALWADANRQADYEKQLWPYDFVKSDSFVPKNKRGSVSGKLVINDPLYGNLKLSDATVTLVQPESNTEPIHPQQWRKMSHWVTHVTGDFKIENVVPGTYQLRAWCKGIVGEFYTTNTITVTSGQETRLGDVKFTAPRIGPTVFEIGIPDRTAEEYLHGDHFNQWGLYNLFQEEFPNSVNFRIGESDWQFDWNYCQVSIPGGADGKYKAAEPWKIYFNLNKVPSGNILLRVSIAASSSTALSVSVNGKNQSAEVKDLVDDACIRRDGIRGIWSMKEFTFPASLLKQGENYISLHGRAIGGYLTYYKFDGIMYDHIRLEVSDQSYPGVAIPPTIGSNSNPTTTTNQQPTSGSCWSQSLGYPCCSSCNVEYTDGDGEWGFENNNWCGIDKSKCSSNIETCWSESQGFSCCNSCDVVYTDESGSWGVENNNWCGIKSSCNGNQNNNDQCFSLSQGYPCCNSCNVVYSDESGSWGVENNDWCGIKYSC